MVATGATELNTSTINIANNTMLASTTSECLTALDTTGSPLHSFGPFSKMPLELQDRVWKMLIPRNRVLKVFAICRDQDCSSTTCHHWSQNEHYYLLDKVDHEVHTMWTCQRSRESALRALPTHSPLVQLTFDSTASTILFQSQTTTCCPSLPRTNDLRISHRDADNVPTRLAWSNLSERFQQIQHLAISIHDILINHGFPSHFSEHTIQRLPNLKSLTIVAVGRLKPSGKDMLHLWDYAAVGVLRTKLLELDRSAPSINVVNTQYKEFPRTPSYGAYWGR